MNNSYVKIMKYATDCVYWIRIQSYATARKCFEDIISILTEMLSKNATDELVTIVKEFYSYMEVEDMIYTGDYLEEVFIPYIKTKIVSDLGDIEKIDTLLLEPTSSGQLTCKDTVFNKYLHSNVNPVEEAQLSIRASYDASKNTYAVWGLGLGYHINELYAISMGSIDIEVYTDNKNLMDIISERNIFDGRQNRIHIHYDQEAILFTNYIASCDCGIYMHYPSVLCIKNEATRNMIRTFYVSWNSVNSQRLLLDINFRSNINNCKHFIDELRGDFEGKTAIVVGGGPSVDMTISYLKAQKGQKIIMATSTVLGKLQKLGIEPDYCVISDPQARTFGHTKNVINKDVPVICVSTTYWEFIPFFTGKKYIALQSQYKQSENFAKKNNNILITTGGTVVSSAMSLLAALGIAKIELTGVDMGYPGNVSHAAGTMDNHNVQSKGMPQIEDVNGGMINTSTLFISYIKWMVQEIKNHPSIVYVNLSPVGAKIEGTIHNPGGELFE